MDVVKYLGVIGLTLMVVKYATPVEWIKEYFNVSMGSKNTNLFKIIIQGALNCAFCLGFWMGLGFYQNFYWAVIMSFSAEISCRIYNKLTELI